MTEPEGGPPSALVWIRRDGGGGADDDQAFRATHVDGTIELRAVDAVHVGAGIVITPRDVRGQATVPRDAITGIGCAAVGVDRWDLIVVAGARVAIAHGTPASVAALARELARELGVPHVDPGMALMPPVPRGWSVARPTPDQVMVSHTTSLAALALAVPVGIAIAAVMLVSVLAPMLELGDLGMYGAIALMALVAWRVDATRSMRRHQQQIVVLDRVGLQLRAGATREVVPLALVERFVPRALTGAASELATVAAIAGGREVELITTRDPDGRATRAIATRLNVELDRLRAPGKR